MSIYETYGRLAEAYDAECENHRQTVALLRALKSGEVKMDALIVTDDNRWAIVPTVEIEEEVSENAEAAVN